MRIYLPSTLQELAAGPATSGRIGLGPRNAHAVTPHLERALLDTEDAPAQGPLDLEELEFAALLAAADDSLVEIARTPQVPWQRTVVSLDVPDDAVEVVDEPDSAPSTVRIVRELGDLPVACVHVDETEAAQAVEAALGGEEAALEALADLDLLWYATSELAEIPGLPEVD